MTRGSDEKPVRRILVSPSSGEEYVVELRKTLILVRPKGSRKGGGQEVAIGPGQIHQRLLIARIDEDRKAEKALKRPRKLKVARGIRFPGK